MIKRNA
jgi:dynein heavy chain